MKGYYQGMDTTTFRAVGRGPRLALSGVALLFSVVVGCAVNEGNGAQQPRSPGAGEQAGAAGSQARTPQGVLTGGAALGDWTTDAPGVRRRITTADLPQPFDTKSVDNDARLVPRPEGAWPKAPAGFKAEEFATGLTGPRLVRVAPNGDIFIAESRAHQIRVLRAGAGKGKAESMEVFAAAATGRATWSSRKTARGCSSRSAR